MTDLSAQKRLAADILDVGENRVWLDPGEQEEIAEAITRDDIRELVDEGIIRAKDAKTNSRGRARERAEKRSYGPWPCSGTRRKAFLRPPDRGRLPQRESRSPPGTKGRLGRTDSRPACPPEGAS